MNGITYFASVVRFFSCSSELFTLLTMAVISWLLK